MRRNLDRGHKFQGFFLNNDVARISPALVEQEADRSDASRGGRNAEEGGCRTGTICARWFGLRPISTLEGGSIGLPLHCGKDAQWIRRTTSFNGVESYRALMNPTERVCGRWESPAPATMANRVRRYPITIPAGLSRNERRLAALLRKCIASAPEPFEVTPAGAPTARRSHRELPVAGGSLARARRVPAPDDGRDESLSRAQRSNDTDSHRSLTGPSSLIAQSRPASRWCALLE